MTDEHACKCQEPSAEDFERLGQEMEKYQFLETSLDMDSQKFNVVRTAIREAAERRKGEDTLGTATKMLRDLAVSLATKHYPDVPQWRVEGDAIGIILQIDNMTTGLERRKATHAENASVQPDAGREAAIEARRIVRSLFGIPTAEWPEVEAAITRALVQARITAYEAHRGGGAVRYRHKRRGTEYELIGYGNMQSKHWRDSATPADNCPHGTSVNLREVAIYRSVDEGALWVRPREEFEDGRFEEVKP